MSKIQTLDNNSWVKNTFLRLQTTGFLVLHMYKVIQVNFFLNILKKRVPLMHIIYLVSVYALTFQLNLYEVCHHQYNVIWIFISFLQILGYVCRVSWFQFLSLLNQIISQVGTTFLANMRLFAGTVSANNSSLTRAVPANNSIL